MDYVGIFLSITLIIGIIISNVIMVYNFKKLCTYKKLNKKDYTLTDFLSSSIITIQLDIITIENIIFLFYNFNSTINALTILFFVISYIVLLIYKLFLFIKDLYGRAPGTSVL